MKHLLPLALLLAACSGNPTPPAEPHEEEWLELMPPEGNPEDYDYDMADSLSLVEFQDSAYLLYINSARQ